MASTTDTSSHSQQVAQAHANVQPHIEGYVTLFPFDLFRPFHLFLARPSHLFFNHNFQVCVCVHTVCVLGKHPELKRISGGLYPDQSSTESSLLGHTALHITPMEAILYMLQTHEATSAVQQQRTILKTVLIVQMNRNQRSDTQTKCCHQVCSCSIGTL